jgi:hypothetical protein
LLLAEYGINQGALATFWPNLTCLVLSEVITKARSKKAKAKEAKTEN